MRAKRTTFYSLLDFKAPRLACLLFKFDFSMSASHGCSRVKFTFSGEEAQITWLRIVQKKVDSLLLFFLLLVTVLMEKSQQTNQASVAITLRFLIVSKTSSRLSSHSTSLNKLRIIVINYKMSSAKASPDTQENALYYVPNKSCKNSYGCC